MSDINHAEDESSNVTLEDLRMKMRDVSQAFDEYSFLHLDGRNIEVLREKCKLVNTPGTDLYNNIWFIHQSLEHIHDVLSSKDRASEPYVVDWKDIFNNPAGVPLCKMRGVKTIPALHDDLPFLTLSCHRANEILNMIKGLNSPSGGYDSLYRVSCKIADLVASMDNPYVRVAETYSFKDSGGDMEMRL